jgi:hypothetical protein
MIATTVDEQGTRRVVTKLVEGERLGSCSCCSAEDPSCCILSTLIDLDEFPTAEITQDKLPPSILFEGNVLPVGDMGYGDTENGVFYEGNVWAVYKNFSRSTRTCLISDLRDDIQDTFPDDLSLSYTVQGLTIQATLNRVSLCVYEGQDDNSQFGPCTGSIVYNQLLAGSLLPPYGNNWVLGGFSFIDYNFNDDEDQYEYTATCVSANISEDLDRNTPVGTFVGIWAREGSTNTTEQVTITVTEA